MSATADKIITAIQAKGNDARDLRDTAHEAHHALSTGLRGAWDRERIHKAVMKKGRAFAARNEIECRAVEQLVCRALGVDAGDLEYWSMIACMEAIKGAGIRYPGVTWFVERVREAMGTDAMKKAAERVIALGDA